MNNKKIIISIIFVLLVNFVGFAASFFVFSKIFSEKELVKDIKQKLQSNEKKIKDSALLRKEIISISQDKEKIDLLFLKEQEIINLIEKFESVASESGVDLKINSISFAGEDKSQPHFNMAAEGSFGQIFKYVTLLENFPYILEIDRLNLQKTESGASGDKNIQNKWRVNFEIILKTYEKS